MHLFFLYHPVNNLKNEPGEHTLVRLHDHEHSTNEGSEFLDDAIRTEDEPVDIEENFAHGSQFSTE